MTEYTRMKYASEQRDWVRCADFELPKLIAATIKAQQDAAAAYNFTQVYPRVWAFEQRQEASAQAVRLLNRVIYYQGMRRANLPEGEA